MSVVVPIYNAERFLGEAIDSVFAQTFEDWELVLVDDGSTDASREIADEYARRTPARVRVLEHPGGVNHGQSAAQNLGMQASRGSYIALLDADDYWHPDKLSQQVALLDATPEADLVHGCFEYWVSWTGEPDAEDYFETHQLAADTLFHPPELLTRCQPLGDVVIPLISDIMFRRELIERVGGFEETFRGIYAIYQDVSFFAKVFLDTRVLATKCRWSRYRLHPASTVATVRAGGHFDAVQVMYFRWLRRYLDARGVDDPAVRDAYERASAPYWQLRHPVWFRVYPLVYRSVGRRFDLVRQRLRRTGPRLLRTPADAHYEGRVDTADSTTVVGWAWDAAEPGRALDLEVREGDLVVGTVTAGAYRGDLAEAGVGDGRHAFNYRVPARLRDGRPHEIRVFVAGTDIELAGGPHVIEPELQLARDVRRAVDALRARRAGRPTMDGSARG